MAKTKRVCTLLLRLMALGATLSAAIVMATSHERATYFSVSFEAKYSHTPAFKYFVIANAIVSGYGFLVLFLPSESLLWRLVFALDVVFTMLLSSGISAALAIAQVGKQGNSFAGWLPICGQVPNYCDHVKGSLIAGFIGVIIYTLILLYSIHNVLDPLLLRKT
ncbi:CASP-like protein 1C1 [Fagus crenata]